MDQIMSKVGSYWFSQKANKEIDSVGDDFTVSTPVSLSLFDFVIRSFCSC